MSAEIPRATRGVFLLLRAKLRPGTIVDGVTMPADKEVVDTMVTVEKAEAYIVDYVAVRNKCPGGPGLLSADTIEKTLCGVMDIMRLSDTSRSCMTFALFRDATQDREQGSAFRCRIDVDFAAHEQNDGAKVWRLTPFRKSAVQPARL